MHGAVIEQIDDLVCFEPRVVECNQRKKSIYQCARHQQGLITDAEGNVSIALHRTKHGFYAGGIDLNVRGKDSNVPWGQVGVTLKQVKQTIMQHFNLA